MHILQAVIMGIVQGLSEFLPISSSAHLVFASNLYKVFADIPIHDNSGQEVFFDIMVHFGTLIAVIIFFRKDILKIINVIIAKDWSNNEAKLGLYIIAGTIVTVLVAIPINTFAASLVFKPVVVGAFLVITGLVLFFSEYLSRKNLNQQKEVDFKTAVIMGFVQGLAAIPGFSRSGWTIASGLWNGISRTKAARYSFLLSIPIIMGASMVYPVVKIDYSEMPHYNWTAIIAGTIVSGIVGYFCIKYFLKFLEKFSMNVFAAYCIIIGAAALIFFTVN